MKTKQVMNKTVSSFLVLMLYIGILPVCAQQVTKEAALEKALTFLRNSGANGSNMRKAPRRAPQLVLANNRDEFFIFNDEANGGYVIVSGDERTPDVLAYSDNGHYDSGSVPCNMKAVLDGYAEQVSYLRAHPEYKMPAVRRADETPVAPLLGETAWDQRWPYNNMCPTIDGQHCVTGCVATATAQVMYYHKWPERGIGSNSYEWNGQTLSADFSQSVYRWDLMTPTYNRNSSQESCDAVALLMKDVGYACKMDYGLGESGAGSGAGSLISHFDYDVSMGEMYRDYCDAESWHQFIMDDLLNGLPVLYSGASSVGGHALVIDGYDGNGYYHFNYGWGGSSNGNYTLLSVAFNSSPGIHFGIKKNEGGRPRFFYGAHDDFVYVPEADILECNNYGNMGITRAQEQHYTAVAVENTTNHEIIYVDQGDIYRTQFHLSETLPDGDYILYLVGRTEDDESWQKFLTYDERQSYVDLNVTNGVKNYANNHLSDPIRDGVIVIDNIYYLLDDTNHEATVTYKNDRYGSYSGDVKIPSQISYNNQDYAITTIGNYAFNECSGLTSVTIPDGVTSIGMIAFAGCSGLTSITIGNGVTSIDTDAFAGCYGLTSITIPGSVTYIGNGAFYYCSGLTSITIGNGVKSIGNRAFSYCFGLTDVTCMAASVPNTSSNAFADSPINNATLHVPGTAIDAYKTTDPWSGFGKFVTLSDQELSVDGIASDNLTEVSRYTIGGQRANQNTKGLSIVHMSDGTTKKVVIM